ncbi:OLC1v1022359C1 [Oldenlandia corymbosa var. corymbosa]|uniref:OLC1v1022359C1 n=1 Tax=Oldenlandia corymbosa var. corymbosa TaxID=529605 RepID=A0AAV1BXP5_OLDCO|nr:OLC1v1022359C1 [Oldenlandia corymbosa var. corymbosa]
MYAKCGCIDCSYEVYKNLAGKKDVVTWRAIISAFSIHGDAEKCIQLFDDMIGSGIMPNKVIFVAILSACSHAGLVELGFHFFDQMVHKFNISPSIEHYGCMVDLLGRAGRLAEAEDFISRMTLKPNSVIWGALLSGCILHKDMRRGALAVNELISLGPLSADRYKQVIKFFAAMGMEENVNQI